MSDKIMDMTLSLVAVLAVAVAMLAFGYMLLVDNCPRTGEHVAEALRARAMPITYRRGICAPDGIAVTSDDRLRVVVMVTDTMIRRGKSPDGRPATMLNIREAANHFVRDEVSPDVALARLAQCDQYLLHDYQQGYWLISSALVRESARRRGVKI